MQDLSSDVARDNCVTSCQQDDARWLYAWRDLLEAQCRQNRASAWTTWAQAAISAPGASAAHKWTKTPEGWRRTAVKVEDGDTSTRLSATPTSLIAAEAQRLSQQLWLCDQSLKGSPLATPRDRVAMPRLTHEQLRTAARGFPVRTAAGYDTLAPPHIGMIDDFGLTILGKLLQAMELTQTTPKATRPVKVALIPKKGASAWRGIAIFHAVLRVYTKARSQYFLSWDSTVTDPFLAQGSGRTALDPVWRAAVRAEAAVPDTFAGVVTLDIAAFFESIEWSILRGRAVAAGLPEPLISMALALYALPRHVTGDGVVCAGLYPSRGIAPGCHWAMPLAKVYVLEPIRQIIATDLRADLSLFVDDILLHAEGNSKSELVDNLVHASKTTIGVIENEFHAKVALQKIAVVASQQIIAHQVCRRLDLPVDSCPQTATLVLGGDLSAGVQRSVWRHRATRRLRIVKTQHRMKRVKRFRKAVGHRAKLLAKTGLVPAAGHAAELWGG